MTAARDPLAGFVHNFTGFALDGRLLTLCADCRRDAGPLGFQGVSQTIRPCDGCGAKAGWVAT